MINKPTLQKCLQLLESGFSLITVSATKEPNIKWKEYQSRAMTPDIFENFYNMPNTDGVGIVTGYGNLEVIDVDLKVYSNPKERLDFWTEFVQLLKDNIFEFERKFVIVKTRNAGFHILYKSKKLTGNKKIAKIQGSNEALIESRGIGGYVWIYEEFFNKNSYSEIIEIDDQDREILWHCCKMYNYIDQQPEPTPKNTTKDYPETGLKCWDDFNKKNNVWDIISSEFTIIRKTKLGLLIKRHGSKSPHSGIIFDNSGFLFLHSTGTQYPSEKLITPFIALTYKKFNGNFSDSAKAIYQEGYGERIKKKPPEKPEIKAEPEDYDFPIEILPENIRDYFFELNTKLNSSIDYMGTSLLWVISMCIGNTVKLQVKKGWYEPAIIWAAIVGKAGVGKTHNIDNIIKPLQKINEKEVFKFKEKKKQYNEFKELDKKEQKNREKIFEPVTGQFIVGDVTFEKLISMHENQKKGIGILRDELTAWIKDLNKYRPGSDLESYLSAFSGKPIIKNRVTAEDNYVSQSFISILGGVQPSILSMHYTTENKDNGLIDRILLCYPKIKIEYFNENEISEEWIEWYNDCIVMLKDNIDKYASYTDTGNPNPILAIFSHEAKKEFQRVINEITDIENGEIESDYIKNILPKQKTYLARFALILNVIYWHFDNEQLDIISKKSILSAEKLVKYFIFMAKKNKFETVENSEVKEIIKRTGKAKTKDKFLQALTDDPEVSISKLAELLGISRTIAYKWIKEKK